jgi:peptide methionine sulfoxide reductase MsrA
VYRSSFLRIRGSTCCYFWLYWGKTIDPTYKEICNGDTGHAEAIEITFDPAKIGFEIFWRSFATHDPTTINRQGMMWERNTAVRYFITTRSRKRQQRITLV